MLIRRRVGAMSVIAGSLLLAGVVSAAPCDWPAWQQFKRDYISEDGRVIDRSDARLITTSEGQSYAMFFALVADDKAAFAQLLRWTQNNLAQGALDKQLPAWLWGRNPAQQWTALDDNSAADADLWLAWDLLEAGRLWRNAAYRQLGEQLLARIAREEIVRIDGLGPMLLPGKRGFSHENAWRLNPSYLPLMVLARLTRYPGPWTVLRTSALRLLIASAPHGLAPDWVAWRRQGGLHISEPDGSYNAIRVYLWAGMLSADDPARAPLIRHFAPMAHLTAQRGVPPERVDVLHGRAQNDGPPGFSAALLPFLREGPLKTAQRQRVSAHFPQPDAYYGTVLTLFGEGWDQRRFRFSRQGELLRPAEGTCVTAP